MEAHHEEKLVTHLNNLPNEEQKKWKAAATHAANNEHDENHVAWDNIREIAKWLGIGGGGGAAFFALKKIAHTILRHV
jgi:hypothetical protein